MPIVVRLSDNCVKIMWRRRKEGPDLNRQKWETARSQAGRTPPLAIPASWTAYKPTAPLWHSSANASHSGSIIHWGSRRALLALIISSFTLAHYGQKSCSSKRWSVSSHSHPARHWAELGAEFRLTPARLCSSQRDMRSLRRQHWSTCDCSLQSIPLISQFKLDTLSFPAFKSVRRAFGVGCAKFLLLPSYGLVWLTPCEVLGTFKAWHSFGRPSISEWAV